MLDSVSPGDVAGHKKGRVPRAVREQQILDISEDLFLEKGYDGTSIEDICRMADVSRPIVYDLLGNKAAIYLACVRRARRAFEQTIGEAAQASPDPQTQVRRGADAFFRMLEADPRRWELLFGKTGVLGELSDELAAERFRTVEAIAALLRGYAPDAAPEKVLAYANLISGAGEQLGRWWLANRHIPRETIVDFHVTFTWTGAQGLRDPA